jgi:hypothetical protein
MDNQRHGAEAACHYSKRFANQSTDRPNLFYQQNNRLSGQLVAASCIPIDSIRKKKSADAHKASHVNSNATIYAQRASSSDPTTRVGLSPAIAVEFQYIHPLRKNFLVFRPLERRSE